MTIGPRTQPYPIILHVDSNTGNPSKLAESNAIFVSSVSAITLSATTVCATNWVGIPGGPGSTDHGDLTGLSDNDHPQYVLSSTNNNLSSLVSNLQTSAGQLSSTISDHLASAVHWDANTLDARFINASGDSVTGSFVFGGLSATNFSATIYLNLPSVTALNGTGVFEVTSYSRSNYVLTSTNLALSNAVTGHLASAVHWDANTLDARFINASGDSVTGSFFYGNLSATNFSATTYLNLPSVTELNGTGVFEVTSYSRSNYVLTSTNLALSNTVTGHLASAVHWDANTLDARFINASGDSVTGAFTFGSVTGTTISATTYLNLPSALATWNASALQGRAVNNTAPAIGDVLAWDNATSRWTPSSVPTGGVTNNPGGSNGNIQFKNGSTFSGVDELTYDSTVSSLYARGLSSLSVTATNISATTYFNLPSVTALNGTGVFEVTSYSRNNYVLTSTNLALSNTVTGHLASAVHWDANTLDARFINASGDSANASFFFQNLSATTFSATTYLNLPTSAGEAYNVVFLAKNQTGATINKGTPVAITGATGSNILITPLSSVNTHVPDATGFSNHVVGLAQVQITTGNTGHVITEGLLTGQGAGADKLDTNAFNEGDILYVSSNGQLTNTRPPAPYESHPIGFVTRKQSNNGEIYVKIETQPEINDIVGFNLSRTTLTNGDLITYDLTTSTFINTQSINVSGSIKGGSLSATNLSATNARITSLSATTVSATTYLNLPTAALSGLSDVLITSPATSSVLKWNGTKWVPATDQTGGGGGSPAGTTPGAVQLNDGVGNFDANDDFYYASKNLYINVGTAGQLNTDTVVAQDIQATQQLSVDSVALTSPAAGALLVNSSLRSPTVSATTYLNLPSGVATWNANKLQGVDISTTTPKTEDTLVYNGTAWAPKSVIAISNVIGNNLISS